jgi:eukaryotic-like serine/threonine-protein kinase
VTKRVSAEQKRRVDALFEEALDLDSDARRALLDRACVDRPEIRAQVEELLRLAADPDEAFGPRALSSGPLWRELAAELGPGSTTKARLRSHPEQSSGRRPGSAGAPGATVGRWRIVEEIGRGGMGAVYLAERADGEFVQQAALKLLKPGLDSAEALARFERERQILASLEHPAIARLLDGGRTETGQPYLVMERVEGLPLDSFCDQRRLTIRERLLLLLEVGRAVDHAHRNLVVHRDLKPSNIVVTADGRVKLLDFGIAKLLDSGEGAPSDSLTRTSTRLMTPEYASPEQVLGQPVTVASDVYQLGLLLYRLLTGQAPYRLTGTTAGEIERAVCHTEPRRPSAAVEHGGRDGDGPAPDAIAAARGTTPRTLARRLRGDLDTIVAKTLRKEPKRRYPTVNALLADLERHLDGRPVAARPDTLVYRAGRFLSRHRLGATAVALLVVLLLAYAVTVTVQARALAHERDRARTEAARAQEVTAFVIDLFGAADPQVALGEELSARELLDRGAARVGEELKSRPELLVPLLTIVGEIYQRLGIYDQAESRLREGLEAAQASGRREDEARALQKLGSALLEWQETAAAEPLLREALALRQRLFGDADPRVAETLESLSRLHRELGELEAAEAVARQALAVHRHAVAGDDRQTALLLHSLGLTLLERADYDGSEAAMREALALRRQQLPEAHPEVATSLANLALLLKATGRYAEAASLFREALASFREVLGDEHVWVARTLGNLTEALRFQGDLEGAEELLWQVLELRLSSLGESHPQVAMAFNDIGRVIQDQGRIEEAEALYRQALALYPEQHPWRSSTLLNLADALQARGALDEAETILRDLVARDSAALGEDHDRVALRQARLGAVLARQGRTAEAEPLLRRARATFSARLPAGHPRHSDALLPLGSLLCGLGHAAEAEALLVEGHGLRQQHFGTSDLRTAEAAMALGTCLTTAGRPEEAFELLSGAHDAFTAKGDPRRSAAAAALAELEARRAEGG